MDPMMMSQMFGGFGGPGMGMNGMNGMNMGMGFNSGQGAFGGFNGQTNGWMSGQENFNANAFGANGAFGQGGFHMPSHQGNFNHMNQQQYPNNDFQQGYNRTGHNPRGRRGRGGFHAGRGYGHQNMHQGNPNGSANHHRNGPLDATTRPQNEHAQDVQGVQETQAVSSSAHDGGEANQGDVKPNEDEPIEASLPDGSKATADDTAGQEAGQAVDVPDSKDVDTIGSSANLREHQVTEEVAPIAPSTDEVEDKPQSIQTFMSEDDHRGRRAYEYKPARHDMSAPIPDAPSGPSGRGGHDPSHDQVGWGRGSSRGFHTGGPPFRGRGGYHLNDAGALSNPMSSSVILPEPKVVGVPGAPTGPKALRQGGPNISSRGRGLAIVGRAVNPPQPSMNARGKSKR